METPRLLSEYFAARAQSAGWISANADVVNTRKTVMNTRRVDIERRRDRARPSSGEHRQLADDSHRAATIVGNERSMSLSAGCRKCQAASLCPPAKNVRTLLRGWRSRLRGSGRLRWSKRLCDRQIPFPQLFDI